MPRRIEPRVLRRMAQMGQESSTRSWGPQRVHEELCREFPTEDPDRPDAIGLRKVQELWPGLRDASADWALLLGDPDPSFVLRVLAVEAEIADKLKATGAAWARAALSTAVVEWIRTVHAARPDLAPAEVRGVAYMLQAADRIRDRGLLADLTLALATGTDGADVNRLAFEAMWGATR